MALAIKLYQYIHNTTFDHAGVIIRGNTNTNTNINSNTHTHTHTHTNTNANIRSIRSTIYI